ncbi:hypothetical protein LJC14_06160 [Treponema sp. OttesenSCG-928-L16]|nr:hypothetical protein [Treponema sp. OttesenSCG-928-L16]
MKRAAWVLALLFFAGTLVFSFDFGLIVSASPEYNQDDFEFDGSLVPWVSALIGEKAELFVSGAFTMEYDGEETDFYAEVGRTELSYRAAENVFLQFGRISYQDISGLTASGLFDGVKGGISLGKMYLNLGAFYTGLLYKKTAEIIVSGLDAMDYADEDNYFAPKRLIASADISFPSLFSGLSLGILGQFDLRDENRLHSQYFLGRFRFNPRPLLTVDLAGALSLAEPEDEDLQFGAAFGGDLIISLPTAVQDRLTAGLTWSSGAKDDDSLAYLPISTISRGSILSAKLTGLMAAKAGYTVRLHETLSLDAQAMYFLRTDLRTYSDADLDPSSDSYALGGELYTSAIWAPLSDLTISFGGGAFFPSLGKAYASDAPVQWKLAMTLILSL